MLSLDGRPRDADRGLRRAGLREPGRRCGRLGVRAGRAIDRRRIQGRLRGAVARGVGRLDGEGVGRPAGEAGHRARRPEPGADEVPAAVDGVLGHADVVGRAVPGERDARAGRARRAEVAGGGRGLRVARRRGADRIGHVALHLGGAERTVVHAHLVDRAGEPLVPDQVPADAQDPARGGQRPGQCELAGRGPVHVQAEGRAVVGGGEVRPGVGGERRRSRDALVVAGHEDVAAREVAARGGVEAVDEVAGLLLEDDRAPA